MNRNIYMSKHLAGWYCIKCNNWNVIIYSWVAFIRFVKTESHRKKETRNDKRRKSEQKSMHSKEEEGKTEPSNCVGLQNAGHSLMAKSKNIQHHAIYSERELTMGVIVVLVCMCLYFRLCNSVDWLSRSCL